MRRVGWFALLAFAIASAAGGCSAATSAPFSASVPPGVSDTPTESPIDASPQTTEPATTASVALPAAHLLVGGSASASGTLGSWTIDARGSDSPWIPAAALRTIDVDSGSILEVAFEDGALIGSWQASYAAVADAEGLRPTSAGGRETDAPELGRVTLEALPIGTWVASVRLFRADGRGDATFYWLLRVR